MPKLRNLSTHILIIPENNFITISQSLPSSGTTFLVTYPKLNAHFFTKNKMQRKVITRCVLVDIQNQASSSKLPASSHVIESQLYSIYTSSLWVDLN